MLYPPCGKQGEFISHTIITITGILNKAKSILSTKILNSLYSSFVEPHFTYCVEVWGNTHRSYLNSLHRKQKRAMRIVRKSSYLCHSADLFEKLEVLSLFHLVKYKTAIFMHKVFYNLVPVNILSHFTHISNVYSTRQYKNLYVHYARTKHKQMCVEHMGVSIWNSIEIETRNCKDLKLFMVKHKSLLTQIWYLILWYSFVSIWCIYLYMAINEWIFEYICICMHYGYVLTYVNMIISIINFIVWIVLCACNCKFFWGINIFTFIKTLLSWLLSFLWK